MDKDKGGEQADRSKAKAAAHEQRELVEAKRREKEHERVCSGLELKFNKFNGREYIESYCRFAKFAEPTVLTQHIGSGKQRIARKANGKLWRCTISVAEIALTQVHEGKKRKNVIEGCYHNIARKLAHNSAC